MSVQQLECSRFGQGDKSLSSLVLSDKFVKNIVNIYKVQMGPSSGAEPLFYVGDVEKFINIATVTTLVSSVGAKLASRRFADFPIIGVNQSAQRPWSDETLGKYKDISHCLAEGYKLPGDSDIKDVDFTTAYAACNYGVGRLEQFHRAFECSHKHRMWAIQQCFDRYRAKETDVV
ncbi:hypothetical protein MTO96_003950 [Rhipicephalus appendiculatus]